jgi:hypothetical protein
MSCRDRQAYMLYAFYGKDPVWHCTNLRNLESELYGRKKLHFLCVKVKDRMNTILLMVTKQNYSADVKLLGSHRRNEKKNYFRENTNTKAFNGRQILKPLNAFMKIFLWRIFFKI